MIEIIREGSLLLPKKYSDICETVKHSLTRTFKIYNKSLIETWNFYLEEDEYIRIPKFYPIQELINCKIIDKRYDGLSIDINMQNGVKPRNDLQEKTLNFMISNNNGIINLNTGEGKTVVSIMAISKIRKKTLILTHRSNLVDQWIDRIETFSTAELGKDIAIMKNNKINESFNNSIVVTTVQTFISALERRREELLTEIKNANFGIMISDELHTSVGAKRFSEASLFIPTKRVFGLSATPHRSDGTSDILRYHLGQIYRPNSDESSIMNARVSVILFNSNILPKSQGYIYWGGNFQRSRYLNLLKKSNSLNNILIGLLNKFKLRSVFVIIERIKFIEQLYNMFDYDDKNTFIQKDSNDNLKSQFIFATPGKLRDGIDVPEKDTLILTSPISNIQQICGRVLRSYLNKKIPIIIDLVDINCYDISRTVYNRLKFYKSRNWEIQFLYIDQNNISKISEGDMVELIKNS